MTKMKTAAAECAECAIGSFTRNNYFTGKLLVERDFRQEQQYYIDKLRLHARRLAGTDPAAIMAEPAAAAAPANRTGRLGVAADMRRTHSMV